MPKVLGLSSVVWGAAVSLLLLWSSDVGGDDADAFYWWYSLLSLLFYGAVGIILMRYASRLSRLIRIGMASAAALLALAGGVAGPIFFSVSIAALAVLATARTRPSPS